ncbi:MULTISPECIES: sugar ABC transporter permease [unclassified Rhizobium]|uniref:carbohydrate ABC transporter permease n=1 Tax=unclassified Rhizobium TaxID=2613769 RepID=UPI001FD776B8|nr:MULTISPECIES: sugar ABC transporter permease [unclassified Rhizobium]
MPAIGVMIAVIGYPVCYTVYLSFFNTPANLSLQNKAFVGIDNYVRVLSSASFREATWNTLSWTFFSTLFSFIIGFGAALALNRHFVGRGLLRGLLLVPYVISAVAASYIWRWLLHSDYGVFGAIAVALGVADHPINFLDNRYYAMASIILVNVWKEFPFAMLMMLAGLQTVPDQLHRAAQVDGANTWQRFIHITVPHVKNVTMVTVLLLLVANLNGFTIPYIMTGGGPAGATQIWIIHIYQLAFDGMRFGLASAYSVILFIVMMIMGYFYVRALTKGDAGRSEG